MRPTKQNDCPMTKIKLLINARKKSSLYSKRVCLVHHLLRADALNPVQAAERMGRKYL